MTLDEVSHDIIEKAITQESNIRTSVERAKRASNRAISCRKQRRASTILKAGYHARVGQL
eukprot:3529162-Prorocentrum_lima.AAC.1